MVMHIQERISSLGRHAGRYTCKGHGSRMEPELWQRVGQVSLLPSELVLMAKQVDDVVAKRSDVYEI